MAPQLASTQSFFRPKVHSVHQSRKLTNAAATEAGNGFSSSEVEGALHTSLSQWQPRTTYSERNIRDLAPGPACVTVTGRIVNFYETPNTSTSPNAAKACYKIVVKDDTGAQVKLWYAQVNYNLRIGLLVTLWTPHVSKAESSSLTPQQASLITSIFPERDNSCYFLVREGSDEGVLCKTPLGLRGGKQLAGLVTLRGFLEGGYDVPGVKILVCVKSIGGRRRFTTKRGTQAEKVEIHVFDDTADAILTLWGCICPSAAAWKPSYTVLLITQPDFKAERRPTLSLNDKTFVDIDPLMTDADWLRGYAQRLTKREHVNQPFPENTFDIETAASSEARLLFTLADIDEFARAAPAEQFIGYLSLTILDLNIFSLYRKNIMLCAECCGVPIFANATQTKCKQCDKDVPLRINPRLLGLLIDESGAITSGKLIWSDDAWWQLLGRTAEELAQSDAVLLKYLEDRLLFLKLAVMFGWSADVGKLVVLRVTIV